MSEGFAKILILEDDPSVRTLLDDILNPYFDLNIYGDGLSAVACLASGYLPDLIIIDLQMPHLGGFELLKTLRDSGSFQRIPIIILSALDNEKIIEDCLCYGANHYISKPFNPEILREKILQTLSSPG